MRIVSRNMTPYETSPAVADIGGSVITLNTPIYNKFDGFTKQFILEHEKGHINLHTTNELEADNYAFLQLAGKQPYSLRNSVRALEQALPFTHPAHSIRLNAQIRRALAWDAANGNPAAAAELRFINNRVGFDYNTYQGSDSERQDESWLNMLYNHSSGVASGTNSYTMDKSTIVLIVGFIGLLFLAFIKK